MAFDPNRPESWLDGVGSTPAASTFGPRGTGARARQVLDHDDPGLTQPMEWTDGFVLFALPILVAHMCKKEEEKEEGFERGQRQTIPELKNRVLTSEKEIGLLAGDERTWTGDATAEQARPFSELCSLIRQRQPVFVGSSTEPGPANLCGVVTSEVNGGGAGDCVAGCGGTDLPVERASDSKMDEVVSKAVQVTELPNASEQTFQTGMPDLPDTQRTSRLICPRGSCGVCVNMFTVCCLLQHLRFSHQGRAA